MGVPYDGAVTYRAGASSGPSGIRQASDSIETYCPKLDMDLADAVYVDFGDVNVSNAPPGGEALCRHVRAQIDRLPPMPIVAMGGDHLIAYPFIMRTLERHPDLQILHIDAHTDLRASWEGEPFNHATVMGRVLDALPQRANLYQWGIRSGLRAEFRVLAEHPRVERIPNTFAAGLTLVDRLVHTSRPVYVTLDADGIDPSEIPGTGTPEPGGLRFGEVEDVIVALTLNARRFGVRVVGADLVEVAPSLDPSGISAVAGARLVRTLLLALAATNGSDAVPLHDTSP